MADFIRNGIGSTAELTDSTGAALQSYTFDPYGFTSTNGGSANSYQYIGRETDATGLYEFRNRYYDPVTEKFISEDPIGLAGGPNLYEYSADNPTTYSDPSGKFFVQGCLLGVAAYEWNQIGQGLAGRKMNTGWKDAKAAAEACAIGFVSAGIGEMAFEGAGVAAGAYVEALGGLGPDAIEAEGNAAAVGSTLPSVPLFRAVGLDELSSIRDEGTYGSSPSQGGKYFALTQQGAEDFANNSFNAGQQMTVTGTSVPQSIFDQGFQFNDPGGAGPSIHFEQDFLPILYDSMGPISIY